jgi:hypothetical protein
MDGKLDTDHKDMEMPRPQANADTARCGVGCPLHRARPVLSALEASLCADGGDVVRVKNAYDSTPEAVAAAFGYRAILTNYRMVCSVVTYADVADRLREMMEEPENKGSKKEEVAGIQRWLDETESVSGTRHVLEVGLPLAQARLSTVQQKIKEWEEGEACVDGDIYKKNPGYYSQELYDHLKLAYPEEKQAALAPLTQEVEALTATIASLETKMGQEEEEEVPAQVVTLLVETQLILPIYLEGRKASHWPYKMFRCKREGDVEWELYGEKHTDPGGMRAALLQFLDDIATQ